MKKSQPVEIISTTLILLFVYTAISKFLSLDHFEDVLWQAPLIGNGAGVVARAVPLTELAIALLLFFPGTRLKGLYASFGLLVLFTGYLIFMILSDSTLPCQCGGVISSLSWMQHIFFNLFFIGITWWGIRSGRLG
jgi:hypothetical protein